MPDLRRPPRAGQAEVVPSTALAGYNHRDTTPRSPLSLKKNWALVVSARTEVCYLRKEGGKSTD